MKRLISAEEKTFEEKVDGVDNTLNKISNSYDEISDDYEILLQNLSILYKNYPEVYEEINKLSKLPTTDEIKDLIKNINDFNNAKNHYTDPNYLENYIDEDEEENE